LDFRRDFERALARLLVDAFDVSETDPDPDSPVPARLRVVASSVSGGAGREAGVLTIVTGAAAVSTLPRLDAGDIGSASLRWTGFLRRLGDALQRPGLPGFAEAGEDAEALRAWALSFPGDPLAQDVGVSLRADVLMQRAARADAERDRLSQALETAERDHDDAVRRTRLAARETARLETENAQLQAEVDRLRAMAEDGAYPLADIDPPLRELAAQARATALRARLIAAEADAVARERSGVRSWTSTGASYDGDTRNDLPDGLGVMWFGRAASRFAGYRGEHRQGQREGVGVGLDSDGNTWSGEWNADQACGLGVLEAADGRRFEGRVKAGPAGPEGQEGWTWPARRSPGRDGGVLRAEQPRRLPHFKA
jgi:hypothetical protein